MAIVAFFDVFFAKVLLLALCANVLCAVAFVLVAFYFFVLWIHAHDGTPIICMR